MKAPLKYRTKRGHQPRARLHAEWSPIGQKQRRSGLVRLLGAFLGVFLVFGLAADAYAQQFLSGLPSVAGLDTASFSGDTLITDRDGTLLADVGNQGDHRLIVPLNKISPKMIQGTVAIEDKNFYRNQGFDLEGIFRAALNNQRSGQVVGGGSTITQQLAKQLFLSPEQTLDRKLKEVVLAYELSQTYTKNQILELYLNKNFYGHQAYGVQAAAKIYFNEDAIQLDLAQGAMLSGIPQAPVGYDPITHPDAAKTRQRQVLDAMVRNGDITPDEADIAAAEKLTYSTPRNDFIAPHFVEYVQEELLKLGFKPGVQEIRVQTTLDLKKQQLGEQTVRDNLNANLFRDHSGDLSSAMVAEDPKTGQILVMVGSPDYNAPKGQINLVANAIRNPGSSIKPFTYGAVINARRATMSTPIYDGPSPLELPQGAGLPPYKVYNYDKGTHGTRPLKECLANSLNIPAVKVELAIGVPAVVEFDRNLGMFPRVQYQKPTGEYYFDTKAPLYDYGPSLTLGGYGIKLLEELSALSVYADLGVAHEPEAILAVTDQRGKVLYQADAARTQRQALDPGVAFIMAQIMSDDNNRAAIFGYGSPLHLPDRAAAAKTGTTDDFRDALTIGFTPDLASVIWVGDIGPINQSMSYGSDGVYVAAPAWHTFMEGALRGVPDKWYGPPADVVAGPGNNWYLTDATKIDRLPNDSLPSPSAAPPDYGIPADPGTGPQVVATPTPTPGPTPKPRPSPH